MQSNCLFNGRERGIQCLVTKRNSIFFPKKILFKNKILTCLGQLSQTANISLVGYCALFVFFIVAFLFSFFFGIIFCRILWGMTLTAWVTAVVPIRVVVSIRVVVRVRVTVRVSVRGGVLYSHCRMYSHCRERSCGVDCRMYCWVCVRVWVVVWVAGVLIGVLSVVPGISGMFIPRVVDSTGLS